MPEPALMDLLPWLLVVGPLAGATIVYLLPHLPWRLILAGLVAAIIIVEVL